MKTLMTLLAAALVAVMPCRAYFLQYGQQTFNPAILEEAKKGNPNAMNDVGFWYLLGQGITQDRELGLEWLGKAADMGSLAAYMNLSDYYMNEGRDYDQARKWLLKADENQVSIAAWNLGVVYQAQACPFRNDSTAIEYFKKSRENQVNVDDALVMIGICYDNLNQKAEALQYFNEYAAIESARTRNPQYYGLCMHKLGEYAWSGKADGKRDDEAAFRYFQISSDVGYETSFIDLGNCYASGRGVARDSIKALEFYQFGIDKYNNTECRQRAAIIYNLGVQSAGIDPNPKKAYNLLAGLPNPDSYTCLILGTILYEDHKYEEAIQFLNEVCCKNQGRLSGFAYVQLYRCYLNGYGVEKDKAKADEMLELARARKCEIADEIDENRRLLLEQLMGD